MAQARDEDVVAAVLAGHTERYEELVGRYQGRVVNYLYRVLHSLDDAHDLAQEVFFRVYRALDRYDSQFKFSTWLFRVAQNAAIDSVRKRRVHLVSMERPETEESDGGSFEFKSDDRGRVEVADPMRLIWSATGERPPGPGPGATVRRWTFSAELDGQVIATQSIAQRAMAEDVRAAPLRERGLVGTTYHPPGAGPHPAMIVLPGSQGGVPGPGGFPGGVPARGRERSVAPRVFGGRANLHGLPAADRQVGRHTPLSTRGHLRRERGLADRALRSGLVLGPGRGGQRPGGGGHVTTDIGHRLDRSREVEGGRSTALGA